MSLSDAEVSSLPCRFLSLEHWFSLQAGLQDSAAPAISLCIFRLRRANGTLPRPHRTKRLRITECLHTRTSREKREIVMTASDVLVECLIDWGVEVIFGLPGDGIDGVMESLRTHQDEIRFIQVRHEESAAFMACGYAKYTGKLGACLATSGPGGIHLLNGLYDARMDSQPVLALTGMHYHDLIGTMAQQDVELDKLYEDVTVFNERVMGVTHVENLADLACRTA